ncbi:type I-E CRISPR-associated protein Cas5/CasD [Salisaeta longa]|uniref:type I-E CRISPR-associated protein Cas5/CasD n=1 Tax=Salisaeta longa TaxID=503170 RepID=UPI000414EF45|nr:type I-E CRISPR-associated protein Cas5/CasD [Salisaeta longa]
MIDFSFFLEPPELDVAAVLTIEALTPLSMSTAQPGTYYRSQPAPSEAMLYGLLENALGWHFPEDVRTDVLKQLRQAAKDELGHGHPLKKEPWITGDEDSESASGFVTLLQYHLEFETAFLPETTHFDDLWARHARSTGTQFSGGSRNYNIGIERVMNLKGAEAINFGDRSSYKIRDPEKLLDVEAGDKVHVNALRPHFPQFYVSPTKREYVIPEGAYRYRIRTSATLAEMLGAALEAPAAPLYLGSNDGWVEARLEEVHP